MHYHRIPHSALEISQLGLGTMTFGEQNSEADAHAQLDYAVSRGINLIDVAEMYPVPPRPETQGLTETYVGNWLAKRGNREKLVIASKVSGPARNNDNGSARTRSSIAKISAPHWMPASSVCKPTISTSTSTGRSGLPTALVSSATAGMRAPPP